MPPSKTRPNLVSLTFASVLATTVTAWGISAKNAPAEVRRLLGSQSSQSSSNGLGTDRSEPPRTRRGE